MLWLLQAALLHVTTQLGGKKAELAAEASCSGPCIDSSAMLALEHSIAGKEEEVCRCLRVGYYTAKADLHTPLRF